MSPTVVRLTGLAGYLMALMFGIHAVGFRAVPGYAAGALRPVPFAAERPIDFFVWIFAATGAFTLLVAILPAVWVTMGRGLSAGIPCLILFASAVIDIAADGAAMSHYAVSTAYIAADDVGRVGLIDVADAVQATVAALLNPGLGLWVFGAVGLAIVSAVTRSAAPRWYGLLFLAGILINTPLDVGPPIVWGVLNVAVFGVFTFVTVRALGLRVALEGAAAPRPMPA